MPKGQRLESFHSLFVNSAKLSPFWRSDLFSGVNSFFFPQSLGTLQFNTFSVHWYHSNKKHGFRYSDVCIFARASWASARSASLETTAILLEVESGAMANSNRNSCLHAIVANLRWLLKKRERRKIRKPSLFFSISNRKYNYLIFRW